MLVDIQGTAGWEKYYQIDEYGNVWSKISNRYLKWSKLIRNKKYPDKIRAIVTVSNPDEKPKKQYKVKVHILVAKTFIPNPEGKEQVNHIDGNPLNNHVSNLEWNTNTENMKHASVNGLVYRKYDDATVELVKQLSLTGLSRKEVAELTNTTVSYVRDVRLGKCDRSVGFDKIFKAYRDSLGVKHLMPRKRNVTTIESV